MDYPARDSFFAHRLIRLMIRTCAAQEIGTDGFLLVTVIAHTEDAKRYTAPVTFWNDQLVSVLGLNTWGRLDRARKKAIDSGWLHYEQGGKGKVGRYWATIPANLDGQPDGPADCDSAICLSNFGEENVREPRDKRGTTEGQTGDNRGTNVNILPFPLPLPEPSSPSPPADAGRGGRFSWGELKAEVGKILKDAAGAVNAARRAGLSPEQVAALIEFYRENPGISEGALHWRLSNGLETWAPHEGWPTNGKAASDAAYKAKEAAKTAADGKRMRIIKDMRKVGKSDHEISAELKRHGLTL